MCSKERDQTKYHPLTTTSAVGISIWQSGSSSASSAKAPTNVGFVPLRVFSLDLVIWKVFAHHREHLNSGFPAMEHLQKGFSLLLCIRGSLKWPWELRAAFPCPWPLTAIPGSWSVWAVACLSSLLTQPWLWLSAAASSLVTGASPPSPSRGPWNEWDCVFVGEIRISVQCWGKALATPRCVWFQSEDGIWCSVVLEQLMWRYHLITDTNPCPGAWDASTQPCLTLGSACLSSLEIPGRTFQQDLSLFRNALHQAAICGKWLFFF